MNSWAPIRLGDVARRVTVGFVGSQAPVFVQDGVPLLRGQNVKPWRLDFSSLKYISPATHEKWSKSALYAGDVVIVRVGYPGVAAVVPANLGPMNAASLVIVRPDHAKLDPHFLAYLLNSPWGKAAVAARLVGSAQQVLNTNSVADLQVNLPSIAEQSRIADVLRGLDDLIENDRRRVDVLEQMAQATYQEWFVRFRYPGHEDATFDDSPLSPIPAGWRSSPLSDLVTTQYGYTESATREIVGPRYLRGMDINKASYIDWFTVPYCPISDLDREKFRVEPGDVFVIRMADPGKVGMCEVQVDAVFASYLVRLRPSGQARPVPLVLHSPGRRVSALGDRSEYRNHPEEC